MVVDSPAVRGADLAPFRPAIEVHSTVLSRPEPRLALIDAGRRDVAFDSGLPIVLAATTASGESLPVDGMEVVELNDQHGFVRLPAESPLAPADTLILGISHPCTTLDKWKLAVVADDAGRVTGIAHTFF
jgi:D-serine deaminase-like pyridoxal phosphate-dependent protein